MLCDDGPEGPKHVGAILRDILGINCSILCFLIKSAFVGKKALYFSCKLTFIYRDVNPYFALHNNF